MKDELTIPLNRKTIKLATEYARTLNDSDREVIFQKIKIADLKATIAEYEEKIAQLKAELKEEQK